MFFYPLVITIFFVAMYLFYVNKATKNVIHIKTKKPPRTTSCIQTNLKTFINGRAYILTKAIDEQNEIAFKNGEQLFLSWALIFPTVNVVDLEAIELINKDPETFPKLEFTGAVDPSGFAKLFFGLKGLAAANGEQWYNNRHALNPVFSKVNHFYEPVLGVAERCVELLAEANNVNNAIHVEDLIQKFTLDSLGVSIFGINFDLLNGNTDTPMNSYNYIMEKIFHPITNFPVLYKLNPNKKQLTEKILEFNQYLDSLIDEDVNENTILGNMVKLLKAGEIDRQTVRDNLITFFVAGHDTTVNAILFLFSSLAYHPDEQEKCRASLKGYEHTYESLKEIDYLDYFISESTRLHPPTPVNAFRVTTCEVNLCDYYLPKGTIVVQNLKAPQMNPSIWENPKEFKPERFAQKLTKEQKKSQLTFGGGPRVCIGRSFTLMEQKMLLASLLENYRVCLTPNSVYEETAGFVVKPNNEKLSFYFEKLKK